MSVQIEVTPEVLQAWKGMARDLGMPLDAFIRTCVRTSGPRLLRTYGDITQEATLHAKASSYTRSMREDEP